MALKTIKTKEKEYTFDILPKEMSIDEKGEKAQMIYNFRTEKGGLKVGYGFSQLTRYPDVNDLSQEEVLPVEGNNVRSIWKLKWCDGNDEEHYYILYFNDNNEICYDPMFGLRLDTISLSNSFTAVPYSCTYKKDAANYLLFSGQGHTMLLGSTIYTSDTVPGIISCVSHYGKLFAITSASEGRLIYSETTDILQWTDEKTSNLDFNDERGDLLKLVSFDDYIYIFREYGITRVSVYSSSGDFEIVHMYLADEYIYPNSIVERGDNIYFLQGCSLKVFNGNTVKDLGLKTLQILKEENNSNCCATALDGKYYLACRAKFDDGESIGCESATYTNNAVIIYDLASGEEEIIRGVDVRKFLGYTSPYKSKLIACFNNANQNKLGQLSYDGKYFGQSLGARFLSHTTDFGVPALRKRIKNIMIKGSGTFQITIKSDKESQVITTTLNGKNQTLRTFVIGKEFSFKIDSISQGATIDNFVVKVSMPE